MLTHGRFFKVGSPQLYEMFQLRVKGWTYSKIGRYYGKDHSTIMYHCKKHGIKPKGKIPQHLKVIIASRPRFRKNTNITLLHEPDKYEHITSPLINQGKSYEEYKKEDFLRFVRNPQARLLYTKK